MKNEILIKHPNNWGLEEKQVRDFMEKILVTRGFKNDTEVSIYFVGRDKAKKLNIEYRQKDYIPQVLGFPMDKEKSIDGYVRLGDIVICTQKLKYEVKFQKSTLEKVLEEWLEHGMDNLMKG